MTGKRILIVPESFCLRLRSIDEGDLENLRVWKNRQRKRFFHTEYITRDGQIHWYADFRQRRSDFMFIVEATCGPSPSPFGCLGFRLQEDVVDVYNVIRSRTIRGQKCTMGEALIVMCSYALGFEKPITCAVLKDNPAVGWYERFTFEIVEERRDNFLMRLDVDRFAPVRYSVEEIV
jgi:ribosomal protein S18 acetylase RimI-like enzyme